VSWAPARACVALWLTLAAFDATAQETICDPENPRCTPAPAEEPEPVEEPSATTAGETICDPENPRCQPAPLDSPPEPVEVESPAPPVMQTARYVARWGTRLDVDSQFEDDSEDIVELSSNFDLGIEFEPRNDLRLVAYGAFRHWVGAKKNPDETTYLLNAQHARAAYDARPGEVYLLWRPSRLTLSVGNLVTRWGSTDLTRPGDVLNPVDATSFSAMSASERIPQLTIDLSYSGKGWALQGLLVPFLIEDRTWVFGRDTSLFNSRNPVVASQLPIDGLLDDTLDPSVQDDLQDAVRATRRPDEGPANISLGTRFTATFANTDVGVGAWWGWDRVPHMSVDPDLLALLQTVLADGQVLQDFDFLAFFVRNPGLVDVTDSISEKAAAGEDLFVAEYRRLAMGLVDFARYIGPIGVRIDVAAFGAKTYLTEGFRAVRRPTLEPSLGLSWERIRGEDDVFTINVEGFLKQPFAADSGLTEAFVAAEDRGAPDDPLLLIGDRLFGVAGAVLWAIPRTKTRIQLGAVGNISHGDVISSARVERDFGDYLTAALGYTIFLGPDPADRLSLGGLYDVNDHMTFALSGAF
jgi:hypothetical protein